MARAPAWRRWLVLLLTLASLGAVWWLRPAAPPQYRFDTASLATLTAVVTANGTLQPIDKITVGAEVSGRVDEILVDFNSVVHKGQVIARLNTDELHARTVQARAGVEQARANLAKAERDAHRARELQPRGYVSQDALDQAITARELAAAALASARATADQAEASLAKAAIRSPIDGVVLDRKIERGQTVASAFQTPELFVIASDLNRLRLTVDIDEADIGDVRVGQAAHFTVGAYGNRSFPARLTELRNAARTVANVVTYQGVLEVDNREHLLKPGMTATADIVVRTSVRALSVPNRALRFAPPSDGAKPEAHATDVRTPGTSASGRSGRLWAIDAKGLLQPRAVSLGISDGHRTEITSANVRPGERFVVDVEQPADGDAHAAVQLGGDD